ncbi:DUF6471 domain-containing protein [Hyphomonas oceanitis]|uniref:DUF6471 domain-containing protein n=1 Tax=Hyphomonas oceanitis TaxID=81033 RepID=UPI003BB0A198
MARRRHGRAHKDEREPGAWRGLYAQWEGVRKNGGISHRNAQLKLWGIGYSYRAEELEETWFYGNGADSRNKICRGKFTGAFILQCLSATGVSSLSIED